MVYLSLLLHTQVDLGKRLLALCLPIYTAAHAEQQHRQLLTKMHSTPDVHPPESVCAGTAQLLQRCVRLERGGGWRDKADTAEVFVCGCLYTVMGAVEVHALHAHSWR